MQESLRLLHQFLGEIMQTASEDALAQLCEDYRGKLCAGTDADAMYAVWDDIRQLGRELLLLKNDSDAERRRKLAALTESEQQELAEVERIIEGNCFDYHFQPIVSAADGSIYSYEALMRPRSTMGLTPFHILKYAEMLGCLNDIERETFLNILNLIDGDKARFQGRRVFINSIPKTKLDAEDFRRVGELLMKHSDTAVVEMTEQAEPDEAELDALKERYLNMDVKIAIDDYGTGYSNVKNLLRYMPQYVKIDRSLLSEIQNNPKKRHFVREIIEFCHDNSIMALAEGVETVEELRAVILLGADLIQGFYTAKPSADIMDAIPYDIRQQIKQFRQERQDGRNQQIYTAEPTERVLLERLVKEDYECILIGRSGTEGEVTVIGAPLLDTDIHMEIAKDFKGRVILENVHFSNVKSRPCIDLNEHSDVTLVLNGESRLNRGGIRVHESARLTFEGDGHLDITLNGAECFGIGNEHGLKHGELVFNQSGTITIETDGQRGICIGAGFGGNIEIRQGKYVLNMSGDTGVAIGALYADSKLHIFNCDFNVDLTLARCVAIGSLCANADVHIQRSSAKLYLGGEESAAIGTIGGDRADVLLDGAIATVNIRALRCTAVGALDGDTVLTVDNAAFRVTAAGAQSLPFGSISRDTSVSFINADTTMKLDTQVNLEAFFAERQISVSAGRTCITNQGKEILLNGAES